MHWCSRAPLRLGQATKCRWLARLPIFTNHLAGGNDECPLNLQATAQRGLHWCVSNEWNTNAGTQLARNHPSVLPPMVTMWHVSLVAHPTDSDFGHWFLNGWGPILDVILIGSILVSVFVWRSFGLQRGGDTFMEFWPAVVSKYAPIQHR